MGAYLDLSMTSIGNIEELPKLKVLYAHLKEISFSVHEILF